MPPPGALDNFFPINERDAATGQKQGWGVRSAFCVASTILLRHPQVATANALLRGKRTNQQSPLLGGRVDATASEFQVSQFKLLRNKL